MSFILSPCWLSVPLSARRYLDNTSCLYYSCSRLCTHALTFNSPGAVLSINDTIPGRLDSNFCVPAHLNTQAPGGIYWHHAIMTKQGNNICTVSSQCSSNSPWAELDSHISTDYWHETQSFRPCRYSNVGKFDACPKIRYHRTLFLPFYPREPVVSLLECSCSRKNIWHHFVLLHLWKIIIPACGKLGHPSIA